MSTANMLTANDKHKIQKNRAKAPILGMLFALFGLILPQEAFPLGLAAEPVFVFEETFETSPGTDEVYTEVVLGPGNVINPDLPTSYFGSPPGWGNEAGVVMVGPDHGAALWMQRAAVESETGFKTEFSTILAQDGLLPPQGNAIIIAKTSQAFGNVAAWRVYFFKTDTGKLCFLWMVGNLDRAYRYPADPNQSISLGEVYDHKITYDMKSKRIAWSVNGENVVDEAMPDGWPKIGTKIIGSSGSSDGRNTVYFVDNVRWTEIPQ